MQQVKLVVEPLLNVLDCPSLVVHVEKLGGNVWLCSNTQLWMAKDAIPIPSPLSVDIAALDTWVLCLLRLMSVVSRRGGDDPLSVFEAIKGE
jgi:hypothetical protein